MTVLQRIVNKAAEYTAQQIATEFKDRINPFGGEAEWVRGTNDWHVIGGVVPYPCPPDLLVKEFLAPAIGGLIQELKEALDKNPDEKLTFFHISDKSIEKYSMFFKDKDYKTQCFCGDVCSLVNGSYIDGKRRLFISLLCTPMTGRTPNIDIKDDAGQ